MASSQVTPISGATASKDLSVIRYGGFNYYRSCDVAVVMADRTDPDKEPKILSTCVKRVHHPGYIHEDWEGRTREVPTEQCARRDLHRAHEYEGNYLSSKMKMLCLGNDGSKP